MEGVEMSAEFPSVPAAASASVLFSQFNSRVRAGEAVTIDVLCTEHPEHASELREMHSIHLGLVRSLETEGLRARDAADPAAEALLASYQGRKGLFASRYRIDGTIGSGGMGVILRAFDTDVGREVAIKIIRDQDALLAGGRRANVSRSILARFLNEARITGQLEHPAIVPVHEIGVDGEGRPFFAMKLVHGRELSAVLKEIGTPGSAWTRERVLDVLLRVCDALAYAHEKEIIHRDLKPSNVMVGDFGEVYVMDWGLAKRVGQPEPADEDPLAPTPELQLHDAAQTDPGGVVGTAYYMSPEQAVGDRALMGAQSDVYAIGAMLYEVLAGRPPFHREGESSTPTTIRERQSRWDLEPLPEEGLPAELRAICKRAMARESTARYFDMRELGRDLRAFLDGRVVAAYQSGRWAETKKWVQRNRALTAAIAGILVASIGGAVAFSIKAGQSETRRIEAVEAKTKVDRTNDALDRRNAELAAKSSESEERRQVAERTAFEAGLVADFQSRFLMSLSLEELGTRLEEALAEEKQAVHAFRGAAPAIAELDQARPAVDASGVNPSDLARRFLFKALISPSLDSIDAWSPNVPHVAGQLRIALARVCLRYSLASEGQDIAELAVRSLTQTVGAEHPRTLDALHVLSLLLARQGRYLEAASIEEVVVQSHTRQFGPQDRRTIGAIVCLAGHLKDADKLREADKLLEQVRVDVVDGRGRNPLLYIDYLAALARIRSSQSRYGEAEEVLREALREGPKAPGVTPEDRLATINNLGSVLRMQRKFQEAHGLLQSAADGLVKSLGVASSNTLTTLNELGLLARDTGNLDDAIVRLSEVVRSAEAVLGSYHIHTLFSMADLASTLRAAGRLRDAQALYTTVVERLPRVNGSTFRTTSELYYQLGLVLKDRGLWADAENAFAAGLRLEHESAEQTDERGAKFLCELAQSFAQRGALREAESMYRRSLELTESQGRSGLAIDIRAMNGLALTLQELGRLPEARAMAQEAVRRSRERLGETHQNTLASLANLGNILGSEGFYRDAVEAAKAALDGLVATQGPDNQYSLISMANYVILQAQCAIGRNGSVQMAEVCDRLAAFMGENDPNVLALKVELGNLLCAEGRRAEGAALIERVLAQASSTYGYSNPLTLRAAEVLGRCRLLEGDLESAERLLQFARDEYCTARGDDDVNALSCTARLGVVRARRGAHAEGVRMAEQALATMVAQRGAGDVQALRATLDYLEALGIAGESGQGEPRGTFALHVCESMQNPRLAADMLHALGVLASRTGGHGHAVEVLFEACLRRAVCLGETHPDTRQSASTLLEEIRLVTESGSVALNQEQLDWIKVLERLNPTSQVNK